MLTSKKPDRAAIVWLISTAIFLALASCATTNLPPISAEEKLFQMEEDEKQMWRNAEQLEQQIEKGGVLYDDPKLEAYLNAVAGKLLPQNVQSSGLTPRIKVIQHPLLNAFALPHGAIYLHTGILACMENEAQLAAVLGHELTHFTHRHALKEMRGAQNKVAFQRVLQTMLAAGAAAALAAAGVPSPATSGLGQVLGGLTEQMGTLWALASITGYSRELETEADEEGLRTMVQAGYDPREGPKVFEQLQQELDELQIKEPFFFGTHPQLQERIDNYRRLLGTQYAAQTKEEGRFKNAEEFLSFILQPLLDNAVLNLRIGRLETAQAAIEKHLQQQPRTPRAHFLLGEIHRRSRPKEPHIQRTIAAYQEAARLDPTYAEPHRELGLLYRAQNRPEQARAEFERYLALSPKAVDAPIIRGYLAELGKP